MIEVWIKGSYRVAKGSRRPWDMDSAIKFCQSLPVSWSIEVLRDGVRVTMAESRYDPPGKMAELYKASRANEG